MLNEHYDNFDDYATDQVTTWDSIIQDLDRLHAQTHINLVNSLISETLAELDITGVKGVKVTDDTREYLYNTPELDAIDIKTAIKFDIMQVWEGLL